MDTLEDFATKNPGLEPADTLRRYSDHTKLELLRSGQWDDQLVSDIDTELADFGAENGLDPAELAKRPEQDDLRLTTQVMLDKDPAIADAARSYFVAQSDEARAKFADPALYEENLALHRKSYEDLATPEVRSSVKRAAMKSGDLPFAVIDGALEFSPVMRDVVGNDEALAKLFEAHPNLDRSLIPSVKQKLNTAPGYDVPGFVLDRQSDLYGALQGVMGKDPDVADRVNSLIKSYETDSDKGTVHTTLGGGKGVNADPTLDTVAQLLENQGLGGDFSRDELKQFVNDFALTAASPMLQEGDVDANVTKLSTGQRVLPMGVLLNKELFDRTMAESKTIPAEQKDALMKTREARVSAYAPDAFSVIAANRPEFARFLTEKKEAGATNAAILDEWMSNPENHSEFRDYAGGIGESIVEGVGGLVLYPAALAGSESARDAIAGLQKSDSDRRAYARLFGKNLGAGYDLSRLVAPVAADIGMVMVTGGAAAPMIVGKSGVKTAIKNTLRTALTAETKTALGSFTKAAARRAGAEGVMAVDDVLTLAGKDIAGTLTKSVNVASYLGTAFNRSAGSTYVQLHTQLSDQKNPDGSPKYSTEQVREIALNHGLIAGTLTAAVTGGFSMFGHAGMEGIYNGITRKQLNGIYDRMGASWKSLSPAVKAGVSMESPEKMLESIMRKSLGTIWGRGTDAVISEGAEEGIDQILGYVNQQIATGDKIDVGAAIREGAYAAMLGGVMGGTVTAINSTVRGRGVAPDMERMVLLDTARKLDAAKSPQTAAVLRKLAQQVGSVVTVDGQPVSTEAPPLPAPEGFTETTQENGTQGNSERIVEGSESAVQGLRPTGNQEVTTPTNGGNDQSALGVGTEPSGIPSGEAKGMDAGSRGLPVERSGQADALSSVDVRQESGGNVDAALPDARQARKTARKEAVEQGKERLKEVLDAGKGELPNPATGGKILITPSSKKGVIAQITYLDAEGNPTGDEVVTDETRYEELYSDDELVDAAVAAVRPDISQARHMVAVVEKAEKPYQYTYRLRLRDVAPGTTPKGFIKASGRDVTYDRPLTKQELYDFEMDAVGATETPPANVPNQENPTPAPSVQLPSVPARTETPASLEPVGSDQEATGTAEAEVSGEVIEMPGVLPGGSSPVPTAPKAAYEAAVKAYQDQAGKTPALIDAQHLHTKVAQGVSPEAAATYAIQESLAHAEATASVTEAIKSKKIEPGVAARELYREVYNANAPEDPSPTPAPAADIELPFPDADGTDTRTPEQQQKVDRFNELSYKESQSKLPKGKKLTKAEQNELAALAPEVRPLIMETVDPENDPTVGVDINGTDIRQSKKGTFYTVENGRVRTGPAFSEETPEAPVSETRAPLQETSTPVTRPENVLQNQEKTNTSRRVTYQWLKTDYTGTVVGTTAGGKLAILPDGGNGVTKHTVAPDQVTDVAPAAAPTLEQRGILTQGLSDDTKRQLSATAPGDNSHREALKGHDTSSSAALLASLAKTGPAKFKPIVKLLQQFDWSGVTLTLLDTNIPITVDGRQTTLGGAWMRETGQIIIAPDSSKAGTIETVLHEMIHAATEKSLLSPTEAQKKVLKRIGSMRSKLLKLAGDDANLRYGLSNDSEFLSHMLTSESFRASVEALTPPKQTSFVKLLFDAIADLLLGKKKIPGVTGDMIADLTTFVKGGDTVLGVVRDGGSDARMSPAPVNRNAVSRLQQRIDAMYSTGRTEGVEDLESELETLLETADTDMDGMEETTDEGASGGQPNRDAEFLTAEFDLIEAWHRWTGKGQINARDMADFHKEYENFGKFYRQVFGDGGFYIQQGVSDKQIEEAAKDAASNYERRRNAMKGPKARFSPTPEYARSIAPDDTDLSALNFDEIAAELEDVNPLVAEDIMHSLVNREIGHAAGMRMSPSPVKPSWIDRSGNITPLKYGETHGDFAANHLSVEPINGTRELNSKGWARVMPSGDTLYVDFGEQPQQLTPSQRKTLIRAAEETGLKSITIDGYNGSKVVWENDAPDIRFSPAPEPRLRSTLDNVTTGNPSNSDRAHFITNPEQRPALVSYLKGAANAMWDRLKERFDLRTAVYVDRLVAEVARAEDGYRVRDVTMPTVRFMFAGEQAQKPQFMQDSLETARSMSAAGKTSEEIRAVTGWFPGKYDGKMRWEIPDAGATLTDRNTFNKKSTEVYGGEVFNSLSMRSALDRVNSGKVLRLKDVMNHSDLYAAYPAAAEIPFFPIGGNIVNGSLRTLGGQKIITATLTLSEGQFSEESRSVILHEVQHFIQDVEGFAKGGSPDGLISSADIMDAAKFKDAYNGLKKYKEQLRGLTELLATERSKKKGFMGFGGPDGKAIASLEAEVAKIQNTVNSVWDYQKKNLSIDRDSTRASLLSAINRVDDTLGSTWVMSKRNEGLNLLYKSLAGEIEARDVQARANLTPEQLKATAPYSSENIAPEAAIVLGVEQGQARFSPAPATDADGNLTFKHVNFVFANDNNKLFVSTDEDINENPGWWTRMFTRRDDTRKAQSNIRVAIEGFKRVMQDKHERLNKVYKQGVKEEGTEEAMTHVGHAIGSNKPMLTPEAETRINEGLKERLDAAYALRDNEKTAVKAVKDAAITEAKRVHDEAMLSEDPGERADAVKEYAQSLKDINAEFRRATEEALEAGGITDLAVEEAEQRAETQRKNSLKQRDLSREQAKQDYDDEVQSLDVKVRKGARNKYEIVLKQLDKTHQKTLDKISEDLNKLKHSRSVDAEVIAGVNAAYEWAMQEAKVERALQADELRRIASDSLEWLQGNAPTLHAWAKEMRDTIDEFQTLLTQHYGPTRPELAWTIDNSRGVYLVRTWRIHQDPAHGEMVLHDPAEEAKKDALIALFSKNLAEDAVLKMKKDPQFANVSDDDLFQNALQDKDLQDKALAMFQDFVMGHEFQASNVGTNGLRTEYQRFLRKQNLDEAIEEILGRIDDPKFNADRTLAAVSGIMFNQKMLTWLKDEGLQSGTIVTAEQIAANRLKYKGWKPIVSANVHSSSYAPLAGYYASAKDVEAMSAAFGFNKNSATDTGKRAMKTANKAVLAASNASLMVMTLGSVSYFIRGVVSGPIFSTAQGVWPTTKDYLKSLHTGLGAAFHTQGGPISRWLSAGSEGSAKADLEFRERLIALRVISDGAHIGYLRELRQQYAKDPLNVMNWIVERGGKLDPRIAEGLKKGGVHAKNAMEKLEQLAEFTETTPNVAVFLSDLDALVRSGLYATQEEAEQEAARINKSVMPSKSERPQAINEWSKQSFSALVAPFIGFRADMIRTTINTYREGLAHFHSGNPVLRQHGIKRLVSAATVHAGFTVAVPLLLQHILGFDDEEDKALRAGLPAYSRNSQFWMWSDGAGSIRMMDMTFTNPNSFVFDIVPMLLKSDIEETPEVFAKYIAGEVIGENIVAGSVLDVSRNHNEQRGGSIWLESDDFATKVTKGAWHIIQSSYIPQTLKKIEQSVRATTRPDKADEDFFYTPTGILAGMLLPTKPRDQKVEDTAFRAFRELGRANRELSLITGSLTSKAGLSESATDIYAERMRATVKVAKQAHALSKAYQSMGLTKQQVMKAMTEAKGGGFSKDRAALYMKGYAEKYILPADKLREIRGIDPRRYDEVVGAMRSYGRYVDVR